MPPGCSFPPANPGEWDDDRDELGSPGSDVEQRLREALEVADRQSDPGPRAEARLRLAAGLCTPRRQFGLGRLWAEEAMALTVDPRLRARALLASWLPVVLLGQSALAEQPLEQAAELAESGGDSTLQTRVRVLQCLVAHDLDRPDFDQRWAAASAACDAQPDAHWSWIVVRIATERGDLAAAQVADRSPSVPGAGPLARQLRILTSATLRAELDDVGTAVDLLRSVVAMQGGEGSSLLLPEAYARLIMLRSAADPKAAMEYFELLDRSVGGDHGFPREQYLRLLARGAIRSASGEYERAAAAASNAGDVASSSPLPHLTRYAQRAENQHLANAGRRAAAPAPLGVAVGRVAG